MQTPLRSISIIRSRKYPGHQHHRAEDDEEGMSPHPKRKLTLNKAPFALMFKHFTSNEANPLHFGFKIGKGVVSLGRRLDLSAVIEVIPSNVLFWRKNPNPCVSTGLHLIGRHGV